MILLATAPIVGIAVGDWWTLVLLFPLVLVVLGRFYFRGNRPIEEYMLDRAALNRARSERQVVEAVIAARAAGASWQKIGSLLGT